MGSRPPDARTGSREGRQVAVYGRSVGGAGGGFKLGEERKAARQALGMRLAGIAQGAGASVAFVQERGARLALSAARARQGRALQDEGCRSSKETATGPQGREEAVLPGRGKTRNATTEVVAFLEKGVETPMAFVNAQTLQSGRSKAEGKKTSLHLRCGPACQRPSGRTWWWSRKTRIPELLRSPAW